VAVGIAPDIFAFGPYVVERIPRGNPLTANPPLHSIPEYVFRLYDISHSLVVAALVLGVVYLLTGRLPLWTIAWPLHVLLDVPTHTLSFFPTPFLWPLSPVRVNGVSWSAPWFLASNYAALLAITVISILRSRKRGIQSGTARLDA